MVQVEDEVYKEMESHYKNRILMAVQRPRLPSIIKDSILPTGYPAEFFVLIRIIFNIVISYLHECIS